jgi:formiminotetrahydrofolate cyclodeaminase
MVAAMTLARDRYAEVHPRAREVRHGAARLREALLGLAQKDAETFAEFTGALSLPKASEAERSTREAAKRAATLAGAEVQLELLGYLAETADLSVELAEHGLATALGDSASAGFIAAGAARCAYWAVRANLQDVRGDPEWSRKLEEGLGLLERVEAAEWRVRQLVNERIR